MQSPPLPPAPPSPSPGQRPNGHGHVKPSMISIVLCAKVMAHVVRCVCMQHQVCVCTRECFFCLQSFGLLVLQQTVHIKCVCCLIWVGGYIKIIPNKISVVHRAQLEDAYQFGHRPNLTWRCGLFIGASNFEESALGAKREGTTTGPAQLLIWTLLN